MSKRTSLSWMQRFAFSGLMLLMGAVSSRSDEATQMVTEAVPPLPLPAATNAAPIESFDGAVEPRQDPEVVPATALQSPDSANGASKPASASGPAPSSPAQEGDPALQPSEAERVSRLQRSLEADGKRLAELKESLANPESEYAKSEAEFRQLDASLDQKRTQHAKLGPSAAEDASRLASEIEAVERSWKLAKQRFELAIVERKTLQENVSTLEQKLQKDGEALDKVQGLVRAPVATATPQETPPAAAPTSPTTAPAALPTPAGSPASPISAAETQSQEPSEPTTSVSTAPAVSLPSVGLPAMHPPATPAPPHRRRKLPPNRQVKNC